MDTAQTIAIALHKLGLSDEQIGKSVGRSQPTIWRIRNGETKDSSAETYKALRSLLIKERAKLRRRTDKRAA